MTDKQIADIYGEKAQMAGLVNRVPPEIILGVIKQESGGNHLALGPTSDYGLMQITRPALNDYNRSSETKYSIYDVYHNPWAAITVGAWYLAASRAYMKATDWFDALRGYNAGPTRAQNDQKAGLGYAEPVLHYAKVFAELLK